tara:strand:- start:1443 stop:2039 length:597 start_codon:yes stop_codon:yes gene_type:complete
MVNVICCGNQDRNTTVSPRYPNTPPHRTKNCYTAGQFDYSTCDDVNSACTGPGIPGSGGRGCTSCIESDFGGYCKMDDNYYSSQGGTAAFKELSTQDLIYLSSNVPDSSIQTNRALMDYDRMMTNRLRELQIMGRDPLYTPPPPPAPAPPPAPPPPPPKESSNILFYILIVILSLILISAILFILVQENIIQFNYLKK